MMKISKSNKEILNREFDFALNKMKKSQSPDEILYYFTAFYNMINRIYNIEFCEELLFTFFVMDSAYKAIIERMGLLKAGQSSVIGFNKNFGPELIRITEDLLKNFYNKEKRNQTLQTLVLLAYSTTGNGYYLSQKGEIDIYSDTKLLKDK